MRTRLLLSVLAIFASMAGVFAAEPLALTWMPRGEWDVLFINGMEYRTGPGFGLEEMVAALRREFPNLETVPVQVTIPDISDRRRPVVAKFDGNLRPLFLALTSPEREVTYLYRGRQLRRYRIKCSSKGTREHWDSANYWLDGELLGNWEQARRRFSSMQWEKDAIADILFDRSDILTSSSGGLDLAPELGAILNKHHIAVQARWRYRAAGE